MSRKNKEEVKKYNKEYYERNRQAITLKRREWEQANAEYWREYNRSFLGHAKLMAKNAYFRAQYKNRDCISQAQILNFVLESKAYGILYTDWVDTDYDQRFTPSIDRIDNTKGYTLDNMQIIIQRENASKGSTIDRIQRLALQQEKSQAATI